MNATYDFLDKDKLKFVQMVICNKNVNIPIKTDLFNFLNKEIILNINTYL